MSDPEPQKLILNICASVVAGLILVLGTAFWEHPGVGRGLALFAILLVGFALAYCWPLVPKWSRRLQDNVQGVRGFSGSWPTKTLALFNSHFGHSRIYIVGKRPLFEFLAFCILLNLVGSIVLYRSQGLMFMDTAGTALAALCLGPWWGAIVGLASNCLGSVMDSTSDTGYAWFALVNVWCGVAWGYLGQTFRVRNTGHVARSILGLGAIGAVVSIALASGIHYDLAGDTINGDDQNARSYSAAQNPKVSRPTTPVGTGSSETSSSPAVASGGNAMEEEVKPPNTFYYDLCNYLQTNWNMNASLVALVAGIVFNLADKVFCVALAFMLLAHLSPTHVRPKVAKQIEAVAGFVRRSVESHLTFLLLYTGYFIFIASQSTGKGKGLFESTTLWWVIYGIALPICIVTLVRTLRMPLNDNEILRRLESALQNACADERKPSSLREFERTGRKIIGVVFAFYFVGYVIADYVNVWPDKDNPGRASAVIALLFVLAFAFVSPYFVSFARIRHSVESQLNDDQLDTAGEEDS